MKLIHRAMVYDHTDDFLETAVPFARDGLDAGDTVLAISPAGTLAGLRRELGSAADAVMFHDAASWYSQPTRTIAAYASFIAEHPAARIRVIAEPGRGCDAPVEISEWTRYESIVNRTFAEIEASVLCSYDRRTSAPALIDGALRTHPELVDDSGPHPNDAYLAPAVVETEIDRRPLPPSPWDAVSLPVDGTDLSFLRSLLSRCADDHGMSSARQNDLLVATTEIVTNAIRHGMPPIGCRLWADRDDLVIEVTDEGGWAPAEAPGFVPPDPLSPSGFGLWGVRMLCPVVQLRTGPAGTTVRMRVPRR